MSIRLLLIAMVTSVCLLAQVPITEDLSEYAWAGVQSGKFLPVAHPPVEGYRWDIMIERFVPYTVPEKRYCCYLGACPATVYVMSAGQRQTVPVPGGDWIGVMPMIRWRIEQPNVIGLPGFKARSSRLLYGQRGQRIQLLVLEDESKEAWLSEIGVMP